MAKKVLDSRRINFTMVENALIDDTDLDVFEKMTYIVLCRFAKDNECFPSFQTIADKVGCGRKKVIEAIKTLEKRGLIIKENRKNKEKYTSNIYRIVGYTEGGSVSGTLGSVSGTLGVVSQEHQGSVSGTPKQYVFNKTNINKTKTTTGVLVENNNLADLKNVVVAYTTEDITFYKNKIESIINAKIKRLTDVEDLLNQCGKDRIDLYLDNWDKFKNTKKWNVAGYFIDAVKKEYEIPVSEKGTQQHHNFKERKYEEDELEQYYTNLK